VRGQQEQRECGCGEQRQHFHRRTSFKISIRMQLIIQRNDGVLTEQVPDADISSAG